MSRPSEILVVGAGTTGMALALQAHAHGAKVRIVERRAEAFRPSRALIMHPRTLEVLMPLGITEQLLARADTAPQAQLHTGSRVVLVRLADLALTDTPFPHLSFIRQVDVEEVLAGALQERGVAIERGVELVKAEDGPAMARAILRSSTGLQHIECDFIAGCDGPESTVRQSARVRWRGGAYREEVVLADIELDAELSPGVAHVAAGRRGLLFLFALGERATWRLLATRNAIGDPPPFGQPGPAVPAAEIQALLAQSGLDAHLAHLTWSARYSLQHRLAARFRAGRIFVVGDAAHAHSPATGQGMNTGIQDAINLGWKLAFAPAAVDRDSLLDSYDLERRRVAHRVLMITHVAFWGEASTGWLPSLLRGVLVPLGAPALPAMLACRPLVAEAVRLVSQLRVSYPHSPISREGTPRLRGGPRTGHRFPDRAVTSKGGSVRLHTLVAQPGVHVLLHRDAAPLEDVDFGPKVVTHRLESESGAGVVALRPDGYVGFRSGVADVEQLRTWLARIGGS